MTDDDVEREVIRVKPVKALIPIVPRYLARRADDVDDIRRALADGDLGPVRYIGHKMAGSGGGYGFDRLSEIGERIEAAAEAEDAGACAELADELAAYLDRIEVDYGE